MNARGFELVEQAVTADVVAEIRNALTEVAPQPEHGTEYGILENNVWERVDCVERLLRAGDLAERARLVLGTHDVVLFQDHLVWKPPGAARIEWHQDFGYWPLDRPHGVTQWLALDDADEENGCLHYLPGTHLLGERRPADFIRGARQLQRGDELEPIDAHGRDGEVVAVPARAGDLLAHDPLVWHMSPPNHTARHRRALSITWIAPNVCWDPSHAPHPFEHRLHPQSGDPVRGPLFPRLETRYSESGARRSNVP